MKTDHKPTLGWRIPPQTKKDFIKFCKDSGALIETELAAALTIWQHLPDELRSYGRLQVKGKDPDEDFWLGLQDAVSTIIANLRRSRRDKTQIDGSTDQ